MSQNPFEVEGIKRKPIKDMSPDELGEFRKAQEGGKRWNRQNPVHADNVIAHWNAATPEEKHQGMNWYQDAHHLTKHIASDTGHDMATAAGLMSNYSPQTHWATNMMNAAKAMRTKKGIGGKGGGVLATEGQKTAANRLMGTEGHEKEHYDSVLSGPKTHAFAHLIHHGGNADHNAPKVVVDRHALSVAAGSRATDMAYEQSSLGSKGRYKEVSDVYHKAAQHISKHTGVKVEAHQVQAATWLVRQRLNAGEDKRQASVAQKGREATDAWNSYAGEHHPLAMGKEPGTGYALPKDAPDDVKHSQDLHNEGSHGSINQVPPTNPRRKNRVTAAVSNDSLSPFAREEFSKHDDHCLENAEAIADENYSMPAPHGSGEKSWYDTGLAEFDPEADKLERRNKENAATNLNGGSFDCICRNKHESTRVTAADLGDFQRVAYGETRAPGAVDTLRESNCPVCGEHDAYDGDQCQVCGFVTPPEMFRDPNLDKAKMLDLRADPATGVPNATDGVVHDLPPVDPTAVDGEGGVPGEDADADGVPDDQEQGMEPGAVEPGAEGGEAGTQPPPGEDGQVDVETRALGDGPADPAEVDENGEVPNTPGVPVDPEAAEEHVNQGGEPFTPGPNAPNPEEPMSPDEVDNEGALTDEGEQPAGEEQQADGEALPDQQEEPTGQEAIGEANAGEPGTGGDGVPDLLCPACGFEADAAQPTSTPGSPQEPANEGNGAEAGDVCPQCGDATLMSYGQIEEMTQAQQGQPV